MKRKPLDIPPTRNHHQLAAWINGQALIGRGDRAVVATVQRSKHSTDSSLKGTRLRRVGKGRWGLVLEIRHRIPVKQSTFGHDPNLLYSHHSGETYRSHDEARRWVAEHLKLPRKHAKVPKNEAGHAAGLTSWAPIVRACLHCKRQTTLSYDARRRLHRGICECAAHCTTW
jgi:hypothetical protein